MRLQAPAAFAGPDAPLSLLDVRLLETRVLRRRAEGWEAATYLWDADGRDARLHRSGALLDLRADDGTRFAYLVPDVNQCAGCHGGDRLLPAARR